MKHWIKAFRLRTLPLSFSSILIAGAFVYLERGAEQFRWDVFGLILLTTLLLQILSNLANDYGDAKKGADNDGRIGPERAIQSGAISPKAMFRAIVITAVLAFVSGFIMLYLALGSSRVWTFTLFIGLGLAAIAAAIKYTMGKRAYGYYGLGDLFVFLFFGITGVVGTSYLLAMKNVEWLVLLPAITMGCFAVAVLNLNNMRDQVNDKAVGKNTLVVKLGSRKAKIYHFTLFVIAYLAYPIPICILTEFWLPLIPVVPVAILHALHLFRVYTISEPKDFDPELKKVALSSLLFATLHWVAAYMAPMM